MLGSVGAGDVLTPVVGMVVPEVLLPIRTPWYYRLSYLEVLSDLFQQERAVASQLWGAGLVTVLVTTCLLSVACWLVAVMGTWR